MFNSLDLTVVVMFDKPTGMALGRRRKARYTRPQAAISQRSHQEKSQHILTMCWLFFNPQAPLSTLSTIGATQ